MASAAPTASDAVTKSEVMEAETEPEFSAASVLQANIEITASLCVTLLYFAMTQFFFNKNTVLVAITDTKYKTFATTDYYSAALLAKNYGGLAIVGIALVLQILTMYSMFETLNLLYVSYGLGLGGAINLTLYLLLANQTEQQSYTEMSGNSSKKSDAYSVHTALANEVMGSLTVAAMQTLVYARNYRAWEFGIEKSLADKRAAELAALDAEANTAVVADESTTGGLAF